MFPREAAAILAASRALTRALRVRTVWTNIRMGALSTRPLGETLDDEGLQCRHHWTWLWHAIHSDLQAASQCEYVRDLPSLERSARGQRRRLRNRKTLHAVRGRFGRSRN